MSVAEQRIDTLQRVELAEGIEIHLRAAGPFLRLVAYLIDLLVELALLAVLGLIGMCSSFRALDCLF